ncbi:hypothetical protein G9A89_017547 [Geosiphon pyriformis]|nr:hypothetical protein G9A89_017547 [Geosiphon pyriformis]
MLAAIINTISVRSLISTCRPAPRRYFLFSKTTHFHFKLTSTTLHYSNSSKASTTRLDLPTKPHSSSFSFTFKRASLSTTPTKPPHKLHKPTHARTPRPLPNPPSRTRYFVYATLGISAWIVAIAVAWNHERQSTSAIQGSLFNLRYNSEVRHILGENIGFASSWPWISGKVNNLKGRIDARYRVKGDKGTGIVHFHSIRRNAGKEWEVIDFSLTTEDGHIIPIDTSSIQQYLPDIKSVEAAVTT